MYQQSADKRGLDPPVVASRRYAAARKRTAAMCKGLKLILAEHTAPQRIINDLCTQVHKYLSIYSDEGLWVEHAKSLLSHPFSQYLNNEPPSPPRDGYFKPTGALKRWLKVRLNSFNQKNTHFWYSWLQCKRCCLPASDATIEAAYLKHSQTLSKADTGDDIVIERILNNPTFRQHLCVVRDGITEMYDQAGSETTYRPSLRSSLQNTRGEGGALGCLRAGMDLFRRSPLGFILEPKQLERMSYERVLSSKEGRVTTQLKVIEHYCYDESLENDFHQSLNTPLIYEQAFNSEDLKCKITGIIEPLKVRIISRGPAKEYYLCKKLQRAMHGTMRQMPAYRLIGSTLQGGETLDFTMRLPGEQWFSIDYSAATDNLSYKYSRQILDYIIGDLPEAVRRLAHKVLGLHSMEYPDGTVVKMNRGQLMGSILSFPILCLANMGVYLDVTNEYQATWNVADRTSSVKINGDDMLYSAPKCLWPDHAAVSNAVGLELSVGKAYVHPKYLNINSTSIHHTYGTTPKTIHYLNTGLFFGQSKVMKTLDDVSDGVKDTTTNLNRLLDGALPGRQHILLAKFLRLVGQDNLDKENRRFYYRRTFVGERGYVLGAANKRRHKFVKDLFTPIELGGCGVVKPLRFKTKRWKKIQKRIATGCYLKMVYPSVLPLPTIEYKEAPVDQHIPRWALESCSSPSRETYPYSTRKVSFCTTSSYRQCHHPMLGPLHPPSPVLPPDLEYYSGL